MSGWLVVCCGVGLLGVKFNDPVINVRLKHKFFIVNELYPNYVLST